MDSYLVPSGRENGKARALTSDEEPANVLGQVVDAQQRDGRVMARVQPGMGIEPLRRWLAEGEQRREQRLQRLREEREHERADAQNALHLTAADAAPVHNAPPPPRPSPRADEGEHAAGTAGYTRRPERIGWACGTCTLLNHPGAIRCAVCDSERREDERAVSSIQWTCAACTLLNEPTASRCAVCDAIRGSSLAAAATLAVQAAGGGSSHAGGMAGGGGGRVSGGGAKATARGPRGPRVRACGRGGGRGAGTNQKGQVGIAGFMQPEPRSPKSLDVTDRKKPF